MSGGSSSPFFVTGGTLRPDAPSYVERQADRNLLDGLLKGEFCYVLTSRQMGKSSLMVRTATKLREQGVAVAVLDLTAIGQNLTVEQWYDGLLAKLGRQLDLEDELLEFWRTHEFWGALQRWMTALEQVVLPRWAGPLVIFVDEIDVVRSLAFSSDEFFAAIRECHNRRAHQPLFQRLSFCLLGVAAPADLIRDTRITPFNLGRRIELNDFTAAEAAPLAQGLRGTEPDARNAELLLRRILYWTHGHPYLTQRLCRAAAEASGTATAADVDRLCHELFLAPRAREQDDNLIFVRDRMLAGGIDRAALLDLYAQVYRGRNVRDDETNPLVTHLRLAGAVRPVDGALKLRNRIYETVFDADWARANMPDAEVRRQRAAFRRGVRRAALAALLLLAAVAIALLLQWPMNEKRTLRDGSTLALQKISFGQRHTFEPGRVQVGWISDWLPRWAPVWLKQLAHSGGARHEINGRQDKLVFWATQDRMPAPGTRLIAAIGDERGLEFQRGSVMDYESGYSTQVDADLTVHCWAFTTFPRRAGQLVLRVYAVQPFANLTGAAAKSPELMAEFKVENPQPSPPSPWRPAPLPLTNHVEDLEIVLREIKPTEMKIKSAYGESADSGINLGAVFEVRRGGRVSSGWKPVGIEAVAASGNTLRLMTAFVPPQLGVAEGDQCVAYIAAGALAAEEAWKLRVKLQRWSNFEPEETWTLRGLAVPQPGTAMLMNTNATVQGFTLRLAGFAAANVSLPAGGTPARHPYVLVHLTPVKNYLPLKLARAVDGRGRQVSAFESMTYDPALTNRMGAQFVLLNLAPDAGTVDLTFAIAREYTTEFLIRTPEMDISHLQQPAR